MQKQRNSGGQKNSVDQMNKETFLQLLPFTEGITSSQAKRLLLDSTSLTSEVSSSNDEHFESKGHGDSQEKADRISDQESISKEISKDQNSTSASSVVKTAFQGKACFVNSHSQIIFFDVQNEVEQDVSQFVRNCLNAAISSRY